MNVYLDYAIALGVFLFIFGLSVSFVNNYFVNVQDNYESSFKRGLAFNILNLIEREELNTNYSEFALSSTAYKFYITLNNTLGDFSNESMTFNLSQLGFSGIDNFSVKIYEGGDSKNYQINGKVYSFRINTSLNDYRIFEIWFDDDSNFTDRSSNLGGLDNNLSQAVYSPTEFNILQYKKINQLSNANYTKLKNKIGTEHDFNIQLGSVLGLGPAPPTTDVYSLQKYILYQNRTADIKKSNLVIKVW